MKQLYKNLNDLREQSKRNAVKINIFLTKEQWQEMNTIKYKYRLSYSTIVFCIAWNYYQTPLFNVFFGNKLYKTTKQYKKTCIKLTTIELEDHEPIGYKEYNNMLQIYFNKLDKQILGNKEYERIRNLINNSFANTKDDFFDYNEHVRQYIFMKKYIQ